MKKKIIIISGFSAVGKGTILEQIELDTDIHIGISDTTRQPRFKGERYHFITCDEFINRINNSYYIEYNSFNGNYYGTPKNELDYSKIIFEIDVNGMKKLCEKLNKDEYEIISVFVAVKSPYDLYKRFLQRNTETLDKIISRLTQTKDELHNLSEYDYIIINDNVEESCNTLKHIINGLKIEQEKINKNQFLLELDCILEELKKSKYGEKK